MADTVPWNHNLPIEEYRRSLNQELNSVPMTRERKAAIVEELESLGNRTAVENRAGIETAGVAPGNGSQNLDPQSGRHADVPSTDH